MDGENNGKPYKHGWFRGTIIFGNTHINHIKIALEGIYPESFRTNGFLVCANFTIKSQKWWSSEHVRLINTSHSTWNGPIRHPPKRKRSSSNQGLFQKRSRPSKTKLWQCDPCLKCRISDTFPETNNQALKASVKPHIFQSYQPLQLDLQFQQKKCWRELGERCFLFFFQISPPQKLDHQISPQKHFRGKHSNTRIALHQRWFFRFSPGVISRSDERRDAFVQLQDKQPGKGCSQKNCQWNSLVDLERWGKPNVINWHINGENLEQMTIFVRILVHWMLGMSEKCNLRFLDLNLSAFGNL